MAASIQERLKLKQYQVDTWTTREQLCLASAVMRSGDQNWVAVRRNIKTLTNETSRPPDWYSTKNCALQYARLLERVDTPKRKRERGDGGNETPGEIVTKMLSKQRVEELQVLEAEERTTYNQLRREIQQLETGKLDHQLETFWEQLVKEHAEEEEEEQRQQQLLKEREEKITAIQQALKHQGPKVPQPPHKKKPKLPGCGGVAERRRSSGLSETSSEVDSTVESPDQNEVTPESLVSNKSQDESGAGESEARPTPTSPLLSSLLSKSPITGVPGAASSPLAQLGIGSRAMRGMGISPVSEALQNLVSSAISGTNTSDKDKPTHTASSTGTSTLSLLLDLPPSTPGGPLPRLNDLPGPSYEPREQEQVKKSDSACKTEKKEESCSENKGCAEQVKIEDITPADPVKPTESTAGMLEDGEDTRTILEEVQKEEKRKEVATVKSVESKKECETSVPQTTAQNPEEANDSKKELKTSHNEEKEQEQEQGNEKKMEHKEEQEQKKEKKEEQEQNELNKEELPVKLQERDTEVKEEIDSTKEKPEDKKMEEAGVEESKIKTEEKCKETKCSSEAKNEGDKTEVASSSKTSENVAKEVTSIAQVEQKDLSTTCRKEKGNRCSNEEAGCEENQDKASKNKENKEVEAEEVEEDEKEEEEEEESTGTAETEEEKKVNLTEDKEEGEEAYPSKKSTEEEEEEEPSSKIIKTEESSEGEKKPKKIVIKKEDEDLLENQDSKDWVSEEEGSTFGSRKRKISGGDIIGSSSPQISESTPNSPASTQYGDDSENERAYRSWKKPIMILWNDIAAHKFASLFLRPITDDQAPGYHSIVYRPMDLQRIKRNIESGAIRTTAEFQRDIMLMFLNATMYNTRDHNVYQMAHHMMKDAVSTIQDFLTTQMLVRAEETPQKSLRRETRESSAKRSDDDSKRKRDPLDEKSLKKRRLN